MLVSVAIQNVLSVTVQIRQPVHNKPHQSLVFIYRSIQTLPVPAEPVPVRVREATSLLPLRTATSVMLACCLGKILTAPVISCTLSQVSVHHVDCRN